MTDGIKREEAIEALKQCYDPEIPVNVWDLGLVYKLDITGRNVKILMSLTSAFCPVTDYLVEDIKNSLKERCGAENVDLEITFDPPWSQSMMSEEAKAKLGL